MINPYEHDSSPVEADDRRLCGCKHSQCWLVEDDPTNVLVRGQVFAADCVGLCYFCSQLDDLRNLIRVSGSWLSHDHCAQKSETYQAGVERDRLADERRGK